MPYVHVTWKCHSGTLLCLHQHWASCRWCWYPLWQVWADVWFICSHFWPVHLLPFCMVL